MKAKLSKFSPKSFFSRIKAWMFVAVSVLAVLGFYFYNISSDVNVKFSVTPAIDVVSVGEPFDINIMVHNDSQNILSGANLQFSLPAGLIAPTGAKSTIQRVALSDIGPNETFTDSLKFIAVPIAENDPMSRDLNISLNYSISNLSAKFKQDKTARIDVEGLPLVLDAQAPSSVVSGEIFEVTTTYEYSGSETISGLKLQIDYPKVFKKKLAIPDTGMLENVWSLGSLSSGAKGKVVISGSTILPNDSTLAMTAKIIVNILGKDYVANKKYINIAIAPAPLSLKISTELAATEESAVTGGDNPEGGDIAEPTYKPGDVVVYNLSYINSTDIPLNNVTLSAKLVGAMFDMASIKVSGGRFDPGNSTLIWDQSLSPTLATVDPNMSGTVSFSVNLLSSYPIKRLNDRNFILKVDGKITSPTVPNGVNAPNLTDIKTSEIKISGATNIAGSALYRDAKSSILNSGSLPPRVGQPTDFSVHWQITNFATDVKDVIVKAKLAPGVSLTDIAKSTIGSVPVIDAASGYVTWQVDRVAATVGLLSAKPEAIFQVRATPVAGDVGNYMTLVTDISLTATDVFTGQSIASTAPALTTRLESDPSVNENDGRVAP